MDCHGGFCGPSCAIDQTFAGGPVTRVGQGECVICLEIKPLVKLKACGHEFCATCRIKSVEHRAGGVQKTACGYCRQENPVDASNPYAGFREMALAQQESREGEGNPL